MKKNLIHLSTKKIKSFLIVVIGGTIMFAALYEIFPLEKTPLVEVVSRGQNNNQTASLVGAVQNLDLEAKAAFVFDMKEKKVLLSHNADEKLPLASLTKLMTAFVAKDKMGDNVVVTLTHDDLDTEGDSGLREGERWRLASLLDVMLIFSSNDAAHAVASFVGSGGQSIYTGNSSLARAYFVQMMNRKANELGLKTMEFFNESGLDIDSGVKGDLPVKAGGYGSARDVATLLIDLYETYPSVLVITTHDNARIVSQSNITHSLINTDESIGNFPGLLASKTGYTNLAGGNLAIMFDIGIGHPVVAVVLGSTYHGRFEDMQKLVQEVLELHI